MVSQVQYVAPTGNFGDTRAGYYAKKKMDLVPIGKLTVVLVVTNASDIPRKLENTKKWILVQWIFLE